MSSVVVLKKHPTPALDTSSNPPLPHTCNSDQRRRGAPGLPEAEKKKSTRLRWCHTSLSEILCWPAGPHLHKDLQQITGTVWSLFMLQTSHHHPHPKETQNYSTKWLQTCGSNVCGHEVIWKTGAGPPEGHHWTLAGSSSVCLQSKQIFRRCSQHGTALCSATSRQTRDSCEDPVCELSALPLTPSSQTASCPNELRSLCPPPSVSGTTASWAAASEAGEIHIQHPYDQHWSSSGLCSLHTALLPVHEQLHI